MSASSTQARVNVKPETGVRFGLGDHFTVAERVARGKATRVDVPRSSHVGWEPSPVRLDPVELLEQQAASRVPELVPIRYGRMLVSPFTFYRGAAYLMAADLAGSREPGCTRSSAATRISPTSGVYAAPDRRLVFDMNDFDETLPGPFEWDLKRLVASFAVAGRDRGFDDRPAATDQPRVSRSYRGAMAEFAVDAHNGRLVLAGRHRGLMDRVGAGGERQGSERFQRNVAKARTKDSLAAFKKLTDDRRRRAADRGEPAADRPGLGPRRRRQELEAARHVVREYRETLQGDRRHLLERFRLVDAARKVVGVGSVGTRAYIVLLLGRDDEDPLFLQMKEAQASVLEPFLGKSEFGNHGQRVVEGQRLMQAASDRCSAGFAHGIDGVERDFYLRQLWDSKGSAIVEAMEPETMEAYAEVCGQTLARAHARSGDPLVISSYLGTSEAFDRALAAFAETYADQNERDYAALKAAVDSGRIKAQSGL